MKPEEKDRLIAEWSNMLIKLGDIIDPLTQGLSMIREMGNLIDKIYNMGKVEGFEEGYKEAKRKLEQKFGKLN